MGGLVIAAPFVTYQVWRFIAPGLHSNEKRLVVPFLLLAIGGAIAGALFSHYVLFPSMMAFFNPSTRRACASCHASRTRSPSTRTHSSAWSSCSDPDAGLRAGEAGGRLGALPVASPELRGAGRRGCLGSPDAINRPVEPARVCRAMVAMYAIGIAIAWFASPKVGLALQREAIGAWLRGRGQCLRASSPSSGRTQVRC